MLQTRVFTTPSLVEAESAAFFGLALSLVIEETTIMWAWWVLCVGSTTITALLQARPRKKESARSEDYTWRYVCEQHESVEPHAYKSRVLNQSSCHRHESCSG